MNRFHSTHRALRLETLEDRRVLSTYVAMLQPIGLSGQAHIRPDVRPVCDLVIDPAFNGHIVNELEADSIGARGIAGRVRPLGMGVFANDETHGATQMDVTAVDFGNGNVAHGRELEPKLPCGVEGKKTDELQASSQSATKAQLSKPELQVAPLSAASIDAVMLEICFDELKPARRLETLNAEVQGGGLGKKERPELNGAFRPYYQTRPAITIRPFSVGSAEASGVELD